MEENTDAVTDICPTLTAARKKEPWENEVLNEMIEDLTKAKKPEEVKRKRKLLKEKRRQVKNEYYKELADTINTVAEAREVEKEFALAKKHSAFKSGQPKTISNEKLKQRIEKHFDARDLPFTSKLKHPDGFQRLYQVKSINIKETLPSVRWSKIVKKGAEVLWPTN